MALQITWAIITGEYPPQPGGVSDYTHLVASELARLGDGVHVWAPGCGLSGSRRTRIAVHPLEHGFGMRGLRQMDRQIARLPRPRRILVQYVPHGFGLKGMNLACPLWLHRLRTEDVRVMFHEVVFPFVHGQPLRRHLLAVVTRWTALVVARAASCVYASVPAWAELLGRLGVPRRRIVWLPVPSNLPVRVSPGAVARARQELLADGNGQIIGHFGTYSQHHQEALASVLPRLMAGHGTRLALLLGRGSQPFAEELVRRFPILAGRVRAFGELAAGQLASLVAACDLLVQPYPDGVSSRRTTVMAGLALGRPIVTTEGFLSEPLWRRSGAVALAPADCPDQLAAVGDALLADPTRRARLAARAQAVYAAHFAVERTVEKLRRPKAAGEPPKMVD